MSDPALGTAPWWLALATLLVNDHLLKGASVAPGWVTGKVSDLAFLVVAPPLMATVLTGLLRRGRGPALRWVAWGLVGAGFVAINVSPAVATGVERLAGWVGLGWSLTVDPTDLVALPLLLVAWRLGQRPAVPALRRRVPAAPRPLPAGLRPAIALGSVACLASPGPPPAEEMWQAEAALINDSEEPADVRIRWLNGTMGCDPELLDHLQGALSMEVFGDGRTFALAPGGFAPLDRPFGTEADGFDVDACRRVALVAAPGLEPTAVVWGRTGVRFFPLDGDPEAAGIPTVRLRGGATFRELEVTFGDEIAVVPLAAAARRCAAAPELPAVWTSVGETSDGANRRIGGVLSGIAALGVGCRRLSVEQDGPTVATLDVCLPPELPFPFEVGDLVELTIGPGTATRVQAAPWPNRESTQVKTVMTLIRPRPGTPPFGDEAPEVEVGLLRQTGEWTSGLVPGSGPIHNNVVVVRGDPVCRAHTTLCGARVRPLEAFLSNTIDGAADRPLQPGSLPLQRTTLTTDHGEERRVDLQLALVRAEEVVVAGPGCTDGREWAAPTIEVAWVQTTEPPAIDGGGSDEDPDEGDPEEEDER